MDDVVGTAEAVRLFIHNDDDDTPVEFVRGLLRNVFGQSEQEAIALTARIEEQDRVSCGPFPASVAKAMLEAARQLIRSSGHPLLITSEAVGINAGCELCGRPQPATTLMILERIVCLCGECLLLAREASEQIPAEEFRFAHVALDWHFAGVPHNSLVTRTREFPGHMRADIQAAIDRLFAAPLHFFGIHEEYRYETLSFSRLMMQKRNAPAIAPPLYRDVDIGEDQPMLMRRMAQASLTRDGGASINPGDIGEALDDMLFAGGRINVRLLGGAQSPVQALGQGAEHSGGR